VRTSQQGGVESVLDRVLKVLEAFEPSDGPLTVAEIIRRTGLSKATAHRLVADLVRRNLLEHAVGGGVQLGPSLFDLGNLVLPQRRLREVAQPFMGDLFQATRSAVNLAVLDDRGVLFVDKITSVNSPRPPSRIGGHLPAYCTAVGKVMLAFSKPDSDMPLAPRRLIRRTPHTIDTPGRLHREIHTASQRGVAFDREELAAGTVCVAAPVLDSVGVAVAAVSVTSWPHTPYLHRFTAAVQHTAEALSAELLRTAG
jgi:IclR family acetate operon transcriptional repressor